MIFMILRRLGCSSCYYCKTCTSGFGRLAGAFFGTGYTKKESVGSRTGLLGFHLFSLVPIACGSIGFVAFNGDFRPENPGFSIAFSDFHLQSQHLGNEEKRSQQAVAKQQTRQEHV
jgi:hypothetical protein